MKWSGVLAMTSSRSRKHNSGDRSAQRRAEAAETQPLTTTNHNRAQETADTQPISPPGLGMDVPSVRTDIHRHLAYTLGRDLHSVSTRYRYYATALAIRDRMMERWKATHAAYYDADCKRGYYLSMEFLMGRTLGNAALNLQVDEAIKQAWHSQGIELEQLEETEPDAGLGNGGLGRLAACFLDSCATLQLPVFGYGIRYDYGMFRQRIVGGAQHEEADNWLANGMPWELQRPEYTQRVKFGGHTEFYRDEHGKMRVTWAATQDVMAVPYDLPIPGYQNNTVNTLRLWRACAPEAFDLAEFNAGDYVAAVEANSHAENISRVLYPNDKSENGKELRLRQQYFLASASIQDIMRRWVSRHGTDFRHFAAKNVMQLNDTHPTIAVAELMRLLMDDYHLGWDEAWTTTTSCLAYTNHTLLPEALEKWPVGLFKHLLPRLLDIIYEINARFMRIVANKWPGETERLARLSIIEEGPHPQIRMAHLAIVGSFSVNGVAALHSDLLKAGLFRDFAELWPDRFNNKTNGVTQRRWLALCNPELSQLINKTIGSGWVTQLDKLQQLKPKAADPAFRAAWRTIKHNNKRALAEVIKRECGVDFPLDAMFDVQVKRIHEYKRQLLNALHVVHLYDRIKRGDTQGLCKRAVLFGGKAAPGYAMAKTIIRFINSVADVVNNDPDVGDLLRVAFIPDYRVSLMEKICPAADLSEQISTAGKEASGTGNMKFMMNGALTIGTLDGANIEIREEVGDDHFILFGHTTEQITAMRKGYNPQTIIDSNEDLKRVMRLITSGHFNQCEKGLFDDIIGSLTGWGDYWMVCADFPAYVQAQRRADAWYADEERWTISSIMNTACSGKFSTDRTIGEYNRDIWALPTVPPREL
jgi:glycogen phosphorylase